MDDARRLRPALCSLQAVRAPAAVPALAILAGTAAACFLRVPALIPAAACSISLVAAIVAYAQRRHAAFVVGVSLAFGLAAWALAVRAFRDAEDPPLRAAFAGALATQERLVLEGRLRSDASPGPNGVSLDLEVSETGLPRRSAEGAKAGGIRLTVSGSAAADRVGEWRAGRQLRVGAALREPARSLDPGVPDSRLDLARRGTALVGSVKSGLIVEVTGSGSWLDERAADFRAYARRAIDRHVGRWSERAAAIVIAILIGDRVGLDDEVQQKLREAGTYHVIAISGGNIAILAALIVLLLRVCRVPFRFGCWLAIAGLVAYADLVGGGASVVRATLMAAGYLAARQADHRSPPLNALAAACALILVVTPTSLCDAAFALTFGATLGILVGAQVLGFGGKTGSSSLRLPGSRSGPLGSVLRALFALLVASLSAELALFPVAALAFSRVTFAGLLLNFLAISLMSVAQVAGMAVLAVAAVWPGGAAVAGWIAHLGAEGLVRSAGLVDLAPWLSWRLPPPHPAAVACYYAAWCGWFWARHAPRRRWWSRASVAVLVASGLWILTEPITLLFPGVSGCLRVTVLDVGHADAVLIQLPDRRSLLVDAGGSMTGSSFDVGGRVVAPALWALGTRRLDALIISHADPDHIGGAASVMRDFRPREVWEGIPVPPSAALKQLHDLAAQQHAAWRQRHAGEVIDVGDVSLRVLHPDPPEWERQKVRNDDSLVIEVRYRDVSLVLPGDIGAGVERRLTESFVPAPLRVLKVAHHGSATSSSPEFLAALKPSVAIFSAAQNTVVPSQVLARYRALGAEIFRTSDDGAVTLTTDGSRLRIDTFTGRRFTIETTKDTEGTEKETKERQQDSVTFIISGLRRAAARRDRLRPAG